MKLLGAPMKGGPMAMNYFIFSSLYSGSNIARASRMWRDPSEWATKATFFPVKLYKLSIADLITILVSSI